jgi:transposase
MARWATSEMDREQIALFAPTLDSMIPADHPVRLVDEILSVLDWSAWEGRYDGRLGQPPIHPRIVASVILYGLSLGIRSSRALERACGNSIDFIWLTNGRAIDHSTMCDFRTRFATELKDVFRQLGRVARSMGLVRLNQVGLDGTRVKANSSRDGTRTARSLAAESAALDEALEQMFAEAEQADVRDGELFESGQSANKLPRELAELSRRQERLAAALAAAQAKDLARGVGRGEGGASGGTTPQSTPAAEPAKGPTPSAVPVADPDSTIQPNKEGGFAPNYTPLATVDGQAGIIVDNAVLADSDEGRQTVATVDRVAEAFGERPKQLLADTTHGTGPNLADLEQRGVEAYIPMEQRHDQPGNPAHRADPTQPVAESDWPKLPWNPHVKVLDRAAFVYDASADGYYCPMGQFLGPVRRTGIHTEYQCAACPTCALRVRCVKSKTGYRIVSRDKYEPLREAMEAKLKTEAGQAAYRRRRWICETVFGTIKGTLGVRQFLLRGLEKVKIEWDWVCTAFNLKKLVRALGSLRVRLAGLMG